MKHLTLDNGFTLIIDDIPNAKTVTMKYVVAAGALDETGDYAEENNFGVAHFVEHMLFKGTKQRTVDDINNDIAAIGGITNAYTSQDRTVFYISSPADVWKENLEILSDIFWNSTLPEDEFQKEKTVIIEELKMYDDDPHSRCLEELDILFNDNCPSRQRVAGTVNTVKNLQVDDLKRFMKCFYVPNNVALIVSGNVPVKQLIAEVKKIVNAKEQTIIVDRLKQFMDEHMDNRLSNIYKNDISQAHFAFCIKGVEPSNKQFAVQELISNLLGGGFTSRLYNIIREQLGLAYTVSVSTNEMRDASYIIGYCGLDASNIEKVHTIIAKELNKLKYEPVDNKELDILKAVYKGSLLLALERTSAKTTLHEDNFIFNDNKTIENIISNIENVTPDNIQSFAKQFFTKKNICFSIVQPR